MRITWYTLTRDQIELLIEHTEKLCVPVNRTVGNGHRYQTQVSLMQRDLIRSSNPTGAPRSTVLTDHGRDALHAALVEMEELVTRLRLPTAKAPVTVPTHGKESEVRTAPLAGR